MLKSINDVHTYRIIRKIADGGMGSVYEAIQDGVNGFQKIVALKTLLPSLSNHTKFIDMFVQEAKLVANLVHENIVQIYQLGKTEEGYYFSMEYVHGLSLHEFIRFHNIVARQKIPVNLSIFICSRIARGLAYAHSRNNNYGRPLGIVHRDVCPNNIMITTEGLPKLTDFGIAVASSDMMGEDQLMGKLTYMSPQQANRENVDFKADIFSLGAVLFEMLSGVRIRVGDSQEDFVGFAKDGHVSWDDLPEDLDPHILTILKKSMQYNPDDRYETTKDMAKELEYFIYKDGYGPTIQTLEEYLRKQFPYLYHVTKNSLDKTSEFNFRASVDDGTATIILDEE
ncbi:MAG: serine/threonine protein kinase [Lentisphaeria bacterium]|nr:serine/threonine protein kinase [Lentisphaeria bacterium]NQZ67922.1 serine/threonine protein kinase [Lentisphaeria bacterium]